MLASLGYEVNSAKDGEELVECYREAKASNNRFEVVIIDLTVPGRMGGREAILKPGVRAFVATGYSDDPVMIDSPKYGFSNSIAKPFTIKQLGKILRVTTKNRPSPC